MLLKIISHLGKISENLRGVKFFDSHCRAAFEKSCRLIRLIWSPLLPFVYSIVSVRPIIVTFRHLDTILLPFGYWKRYLWPRLAPPTNLVNWSKRCEPLFECSLTLSVGDLSVKLLWTLISPYVAAYGGDCFCQFMCLVCNWTGWTRVSRRIQ